MAATNPVRTAAPARAAMRCLLRRTQPLGHGNPVCLPRAYHSYDHPPPPGPFGATEKAILAAAYKHVPEHGFSHRALSLGARDAGYLDISPSALPDGTFSLIRYHLVTQREALAERSQTLFGRDGAPTGVGGKVAALTRERLLANKDIIHRWQEVRTARRGESPPIIISPRPLFSRHDVG